MIEIRMNNGVVQSRHCLHKASDGTVFSGTRSEWVNAGTAVNISKPGKVEYVPNREFVWFDAADIPPIKFAAHESLTPEYWAAMAGSCLSKGDGRQAADNWRLAYEKAVQNMRAQARRHSDELQAERKKVKQRDRENTELHVELNDTHARMRALSADLARTASRSTRARALLKHLSDLFGEVVPFAPWPSWRAVKSLVDAANTELKD